MSRGRWGVAVFLFAFGAVSSSRAADDLTILDNGTPLRDSISVIVREAGFNPVFVSMSDPRILFEMAERAPPMTCSGGWLRSRERDGFAVFSRPIVVDALRGLVVSGRVADRVRKLGDYQAVFADTSLRFLAYPAGISVGDVFDRLYDRRGRVNVTRPREGYRDGDHVARLLALGKVDVAAGFTEAQAKRMDEVATRDGGRVEWVFFPGGPEPGARRLMCSRAVPPEVMALIDAAIVKLMPSPP